MKRMDRFDLLAVPALLRLLLTALVLISSSGLLTAQSKEAADKPLSVVAFIDVIPANGGVAETNKLLLQMAEESRKDAGNLRYEVIVQDGRPNHYVVLSQWRNRAAFEAHSSAPHTTQFREKLQSHLGSPYDERLHYTLQ
jgi:quinol monooxygenase YgiN